MQHEQSRQATFKQQQQQRQCNTAVSQPMQRALAATASSALWPVNGSSGSAPQQADDSPPTVSQLSALQQVSSDALVLILQCLTAGHRLTAICRLSRAFHPLPALAFQRDTSAPLLGNVWWSYERGARGQLRVLDLISQQAEEAGRFTLFTCPRSLRSLPHLAGLEALRIHMDLRGTGSSDWTPSLRRVLRSALSLPLLQELAISAKHLWTQQLSATADWTDPALPSAASLRRLTLRRLTLSADSVLRIFSLPLQTLELDDCLVLADSDSEAVSTKQTDGSSSSTLRSMPSPAGKASKQAIQRRVEAPQPGSSRLEQLTCSGRLRLELLTLIASHALQLRELDLRSCSLDLSSKRASDLSSLMTASGAPCLPHLARLFLPAHCVVYSSSYRWKPYEEQAYTEAGQQLVVAYSAQLTTLSITVLNTASLSAWFQLLARCRHLHSLTIRGLSAVAEPPVELQTESESAGRALPLPRLTRLELDSLPLTDGGLLSLLRRCPKLEMCWLTDLPHVTKAGEQAAFSCCPKLIM